MEEATKVDLLKAIRDLRAWNYSISAALALLELETGKPKTEMERLRAMRDAILTADNSTHGWNTGLSYAQSALSNDDYVGAATLLTSIQANSANVPESYLANGRRLLSQAYSRIGGIGLTIDKDSPIAPLMEVVLHLRLGDNELALETYLANIGLFDSNRDEVPLELILFACENHIAAGGDANHERSEDILRGWLVKNSESKTFEVAEKASVQLLLGRNYFRWSRFDVARSEFMTVKNSFPDTEQAIEAEFGIGETFMSQKNYEKSEEVFEGLSNSRDSRVAIRADFMRGVLAARRDDRDEARNIFRSVLERVPNISLANETLYNLAEVYGVEQRYMDQLDLLRAVGRLGQESKRWHEPGVALSIVVQDSDLGISRGHTRIPVSITSLPSGDKETVYLISGGAGKGLFMAEIPTTLGQVTPNDRVLQLKGSDVVTVDYPEEFKKDFRFHMMSTNKIHIAANAEFDAASSIVAKNEEEEKTFTEELIDENEEEDEGVAEGRPANQIKPGNFIYLRVSDKDRDFTDEADQTLVKLEATSGDSVTVQLKETGLNTGIFIGRAKTDELPAGALASDVSIDSNPLMAIDKDADSAWVSEPDGIAPKWLTVDTKDIHGVTSVTLLSPNQPEISNQWVYRNAAGQDLALVLDDKGAYEAKSGETLVEKGKWEHSADRDILTLSPAEGNVTSFDWDYAKGRFIHGEKDNPHVREGLLSPGNQTPVRIRMRGSHDGRFWYELARFPLQASSSNPGLVKDEEGITQRVYKAPTNALTNWEDYFVKWIADKEPEEQEQVDAMDWEMDPDLIESDPKSAKQPRLIVWSGKFAQHKAGAVRFRVNANRSAIYLDGKLVLEPKSDQESAASGEVDVFLEPGAHELTIAAYVAKPATSGASVSRARENPNSAAVAMGPFTAFDFDLEDVPPAKKKEDEAEAVAVQATQRGSSWNFSIPQADVRYVEFIFDEFIGQSLSINQVEILAGDELLVPTQADVLAMSQNDILEITAGDVVTASYVDEVARGGRKNRLLTSNLSVTYFNAEIRAISYDFNRVGGNIQETIKDLMRVDPGERIVIEVTDYDMDSTAEVDKIPVEVILNNDDPIKLEAVETKEHSGIFRTQIDTSAEEEEGKLMVKAGDRVNLRYIDPQNTFPGHSFPRETFVFVRKPTEATARIVETRYIRVPDESVKSVFLPLEGEPKEMAAFAYELPLTVEIIDPDMAKDSHSSIQVKILVGDENSSREVDVLCEISSSFGERTTAPIDFANWALYEGRFVGQVQLQLGGPESPSRIPAGVDGPQSVIGGIIPPPGEAEDDGLDLTVRVLNLTGADVATLAYKDVDRPEDNGTVLQSQGRMISDGSLSITGPDYGDPVDLLFVGEKTYLRVIDPDHDVSDERDEVEVEIFSRLGEKEKVSLEETFSHSGVFTGSFKLDAVEKPVPGNLGNNSTAIETFFGDLLTATYIDETANVEEGSLESSAELAVSIGANGIISSFSKVFADEELAVRTQFHIAESYFELFKSHQKLGRDEEAARDLENGRRSLKQLVEDYPDPKYAPRVNYLLGQFSQELKQWSDAIDAYETIVRNYPEDTLAADAQYKLAQAYEEAERFDDALEAYVTLASTYPNSPLIANVMIRINEYFYRGENYLVAAKVGKKFIQRFESHQWAPKMAFRVGQCHYKAVSYKDAADAFDDFVKRFPDDKLCSEALFWGGESYRMGNNVPLAFQRYNRCRWDFPESDAAKYARGRLALPEMLRQFEAAANLDE